MNIITGLSVPRLAQQPPRFAAAGENSTLRQGISQEFKSSAPTSALKAYTLLFGAKVSSVPLQQHLANNPTELAKVTNWSMLIVPGDGIYLKGEHNGVKFSLEAIPEKKKEEPTYQFTVSENGSESTTPLTKEQYDSLQEKFSAQADKKIGEAYGLGTGFDVTQWVVKLADMTFNNQIEWTGGEQNLTFGGIIPGFHAAMTGTVDGVKVTLMERSNFLSSSSYIGLEKPGFPPQILAVSGETEQEAAEVFGMVQKLLRSEVEVEENYKTQKQELAQAREEVTRQLSELKAKYPNPV